MSDNIPFFPDQASAAASKVDALYAFLVAVTIVFSVLIFALIFYFAVRYRRSRMGERAKTVKSSLKLEIAWSVVPLVLSLTMFAWGADLYFEMRKLPREALDISVIGKQWMWNLTHIEEGNKELNALHVPLGRKVRLTMISEDVIHSFYIPAFRVKADVLPGRYTQLWFEPSKAGEYHLFCAEYCGTKHSEMIGKVVVMTPVDYERWLSGGGTNEPLDVAGERLFEQLGCASCHGAEGNQRGPRLAGLFEKKVQLADGRVVVADENYLRQSILQPKAAVVAGFEPLMPTYEGQVSEEQIVQLISYLKSLGEKEAN
ncbi:MAG: cytochrome c oxidase subunit II [Planctomycetota bacterium]